ncbi:MAG: hypothetical protein U0793_26780 [Gemmataceae bacterium]
MIACTAALLLGGDLREHRRRHHLAAPRRSTEIPDAVAHVTQAFLQVQRVQVVNLAADLLIAEVLHDHASPGRS